MEVCPDRFHKECIVSSTNVTKAETVQVCVEEVTRSCGLPGREVCETLYDTGEYLQIVLYEVIILHNYACLIFQYFACTDSL